MTELKCSQCGDAVYQLGDTKKIHCPNCKTLTKGVVVNEKKYEFQAPIRARQA